uniref:Transmembrane protein n=1 Tax=Ascaris suum TaxID=6253 RepID=F1LET6_ASCSU
MDESERSHAIFAVFLAVLMVTTGSLNTIAAKWADSMKVDGKLFNHPFVQAICMFIGEFSCLIVYFIVFYIQRCNWRKREILGTEGRVIELDLRGEPTLPNFNTLLFAAPACCDIIGTSLMYIGLNLTQASSYQMLRGAVIIFTGLFSVAFLGSRLQGYRWLGMGFITIGLVIVGVTDIVFDDNPKDDTNGIITGDLLMVMAQIVAAAQMVIEQKFLVQYDVPPLLAVGLELFCSAW